MNFNLVWSYHTSDCGRHVDIGICLIYLSSTPCSLTSLLFTPPLPPIPTSSNFLFGELLVRFIRFDPGVGANITPCGRRGASVIENHLRYVRYTEGVSKANLRR